MSSRSKTTNLLVEQALSIVHSRFDRPIMNNVHRSEFVECLVAAILGEKWQLSWMASYDWAPWDLEHLLSGWKIEVKQSAALQSWDFGAFPRQPRKPRYDIAPRRFKTADPNGIERVETIRSADIYIFAWHPVADCNFADHRDPEQWEFFVAPRETLPYNQKTIGLTSLRNLTGAVSAERLAEKVAGRADELT